MPPANAIASAEEREHRMNASGTPTSGIAAPGSRRPRPWWWASVVVAAAVLALPLKGQQAADTRPSTVRPPATAPAVGVALPSAARDSAGDSAAVRFDGQVVVVLRAPLGVFSPLDRAAAAERRIQRLADALADLPDDSAAATLARITAVPAREGLIVAAAGQGLFTITPADLDTAGGETLAGTGTSAVARLRSAVDTGREEISVAHLVRGAGLSIAATVAFLVLLRTLQVVRAWVLSRIPRTFGSAPDGDRPRHAPEPSTVARPAPASDGETRAARPGSQPRRVSWLAVWRGTLFGAGQLLQLTRRLVDFAVWCAGLFAAYVWLAFVLTRFAYSRPWGEALGGYLTASAGALALRAVSAVPGLFTVVLIVAATRWIARLTGTFFDAVEAGTVDQPWVHPDTANATKRIVSVLLWLFAIVVAYPYLPGSGSDAFKGVSVFAGLLLSLGSSGMVGQAISGLVLTYSRALKTGDYVRVGDVEGTVTALGLLSTKVRTIKREEVTVPNAVMTAAEITNFSRLAIEPEGVIVHTSVTIGYDTPWRQVRAMLLLAAARTDGLLAEPPPFVLTTELSDFYIAYQLNVHLAAAHQRIPVLSALHANIVDAFNEHGVQILSPHYVGDPKSPAVVARDRWYAAPAAEPSAAPRA